MNDPQIVPEAKNRPGRCIASRDIEGPFIDVGVWTRERDPYVYLSVRWFEEIARDLLGMVSKAEVDERFAGLEAELKDYAEKLAALERLQGAAVELAEAVNGVNVSGPEEIAPTRGEFSPDTSERQTLEREVGGVAA